MPIKTRLPEIACARHVGKKKGGTVRNKRYRQNMGRRAPALGGRPTEGKEEKKKGEKKRTARA